MSNSLPEKQTQSSFDTRTCPYCLEPVKINATACSHCGRDISTVRQRMKMFLRIYVHNLIVVTIGVGAICIIGRIFFWQLFEPAFDFIWIFFGPTGIVLGLLALAVFALPRR